LPEAPRTVRTGSRTGLGRAARTYRRVSCGTYLPGVDLLAASLPEAAHGFMQRALRSAPKRESDLVAEIMGSLCVTLNQLRRHAEALRMAEAACETLGRSKRPSVQLVAMQHNRSACLEFLGERSLALVAQCPMPNAQCPMPNAQCSTPDARCLMPNAQCPMPNAQCSMPDSQCPMPNARCCPMPDARSPMPKAQCLMPEAQCPMPNARCPMRNARCPTPNAQRPMRANTGLTQAQCPMTERNLVPANAAHSSGCPMQASGGPMQASGCPMQAATEEGLRLAASMRLGEGDALVRRLHEAQLKLTQQA
jgi:hypothetical protein